MQKIITNTVQRIISAARLKLILNIVVLSFCTDLAHDIINCKRRWEYRLELYLNLIKVLRNIFFGADAYLYSRK